MRYIHYNHNFNIKMNIYTLFCTVLHKLLSLVSEALSKMYISGKKTMSFLLCVYVYQCFSKVYLTQSIYTLMYFNMAHWLTKGTLQHCAVVVFFFVVFFFVFCFVLF